MAKLGGTEITRFLHQLGHEVYDPALDEQKDLTEQEIREFRGWKQTDLPRFQQTIRKIIQYDLDWIEERCDALVAYWDEPAEQGCGHAGRTHYGIPSRHACVPGDETARGTGEWLDFGMCLTDISGL